MPRHRCLRATLDWSYDLLSDIERLVLQRLGIFTGRFTLEAAGKVMCRRHAEYFRDLLRIDDARWG